MIATTIELFAISGFPKRDQLKKVFCLGVSLMLFFRCLTPRSTARRGVRGERSALLPRWTADPWRRQTASLYFQRLAASTSRAERLIRTLKEEEVCCTAIGN